MVQRATIRCKRSSQRAHAAAKGGSGAGNRSGGSGALAAVTDELRLIVEHAMFREFGGPPPGAPGADPRRRQLDAGGGAEASAIAAPAQARGGGGAG
jgi:hypothetical protein